MQAKFMLLLAIVLEISGTALMKYFQDKDGLIGYLFMLVFISLSYITLSQAIKSIPISLAYAVWEGLGLTGTALIACLLFNESMPLQKLLSIMIIISGLILIEKGTSIGGE